MCNIPSIILARLIDKGKFSQTFGSQRSFKRTDYVGTLKRIAVSLLSDIRQIKHDEMFRILTTLS